MKKYIFILLLPFILLFMSACAGKNIPSSEQVNSAHAQAPFFMSKPQPTTPVVPVFDEKYEAHKPVNYRKSDNLHMSASAMFMPTSLKEIAKPAKKIKAVLYIFDLRQETHGYINDKPVTWQAPNDWGNADMNHGEVVQRERRLLLDTEMGSKIADKTVQSTETEESVVRSRGYEYVRLTVLNHLRPSDTETDLFLEAVKALPEKNWVHFHDHEGKGRSTIFMILYDMLQNARTDSFEAIVKRNIELSQDENVLTIPAPGDEMFTYQKELSDFIHEFYNYAKAHPKAEGMLWTEWMRK